MEEGASRAVRLVRENEWVSETVFGDLAVLGPAALTLEREGVVTGDLFVEVGAAAVVRGTVLATVRNRGGDVCLYGHAGALVDAAAGAATVVAPEAVVGGAAS